MLVEYHDLSDAVATVLAIVGSSLIWSVTRIPVMQFVPRRILMTLSAVGALAMLPIGYVLFQIAPPALDPLAWFGVCLAWTYAARCFLAALVPASPR